MKNRILLLAFAIITAFASPLRAEIQFYDYTSAWIEFQDYINKKFPESADKMLDSIEYHAFADNNQPQLLKSILYRQLVFNLRPNDQPLRDFINYAETKFDVLDSVSAAILHEEIGGIYENYLNKNYWSINRNIAIEGDLSDTELKYWGKQNFYDVIEHHYTEALKPIQALKKSGSRDYFFDKTDIDTYSIDYEKTTFEFLFHRIEKYYQSRCNNENIVPDRALLWLPDAEFVAIDFGDHDDALIQCLKIYQELIDFNLQNGDENVLIFNDYKRLQFVKGITNDNEQYQKALQQLISAHKDHPFSAEMMAEYAYNLVSLYKLNPNDSAYYHNLLKAKEICHNAIAKFKNSPSIEQCKEIIDQITESCFQTSLNEIQLPNENIPFVLEYQNVKKLYYRIINVSKDEWENLNSSAWKPVKMSELTNLEPTLIGSIQIPEETDYRVHSTVVALPKLDKGLYYILFSTDRYFMDEKSITSHFIQVSNLNFITDQDETLYTIDRKTGHPVANVRVEICTKRYNEYYHCYKITPLKHQTSDKNGKVVFRHISGGRQFPMILSQGDDMLIVETPVFFPWRRRQLYLTIGRGYKHTNLFTDRAIYRPGQTVNFYGIVTKTRNSKKSLATLCCEEIALKDANYQKLEFAQFKTDSYGSFSGSFNIPPECLNGIFRLSGKYGSTTIRVEEYKRPTFEVSFEKVKEQYQLNQEVTLHGKAAAFGGFGLDSVEYKYQVVRKTSFPWHCSWWSYPQIDDDQVEYGEAHTDEEGNFAITFNLKPSMEVEAKLQPVFTYEIEVTATSAQGETHSNSYFIRAGYNNLAISTNLAGIMDVSEADKYFIEVVNMEGEPATTRMNRKYYRIKEEEKISYFEATDKPYTLDRQIYSDKALDSLFPNYSFYPKNERVLVYEDEIDVDGRTDFVSKNFAFETGKYFVELHSLDDSLAIAAEEFLVVGDKGKMPITTLSWNYIDKEKAQPGDEIHFTLGSSAKNAKMWVQLVKGTETLMNQWIDLDSNTKTLTYQVTEEDRGNLILKTAIEKDNCLYISNKQISVPYDNLDLNVKLATMRDKLTPGVEETWEVTVSDYQNHPEQAAVLAGMYDASLDEFADIYWGFGMKPSILLSRSFLDDQHHFTTMGSDKPKHVLVALFNFTLPSDAPFFDFAYINRFYNYSRPRYEFSNTNGRVGRLKGKITDETGEGVPFANVIIEKGGKQVGGTSSDFDGNYDINPVSPGTYTLKVSCVGYKAFVCNGIVIPANKITFYNVKMEDHPIMLEDAVVVDYAIPLISADNTTSGASITAEEITKLPNRSATGVASSVGGVFSNDGEVGNIRSSWSGHGSNYYEMPDESVEAPTDTIGRLSKSRISVSPRTNFDETAFFTSMRTNADGSATFSFTMPDAVTRWRLMMLAYTKDNKTGYKEYSFSSSKPVMIMADMPRYMYDTDTLWFVANVINTGDEVVKPEVRLQVFDASTMEQLDCIATDTLIQMDEIVAGRSKKVRWKVVAHHDTPLLAFRFTAYADDFSDAEQHLLPVFSSDIYTTQTIPLAVNAESEKTFDLPLSDPTSRERDYALTIDFSTNPIWYAIQALPNLDGVPTYCVENAFYVFYANTLSAYISDNIPNLTSYIRKWKIETPNAFISKLEQDPELKAILLQETPWVLDAKDEPEQRSRITLLFNALRLPKQQSNALNLIEKQQKGEGAWAWRQDMPISTYTTTYILSGFGKLDKMGALSSLNPSNRKKTDGIIKRAIEYLEKDVADTYRELRKKPLNHYISSTTIYELYALSFFEPQNSDRDFLTAQNYFLNCIDEKWTNLNFNMRSKAALISYRRGHQPTAKLMIQSFKECAQKNEQIGMYWPKKYFAFESHIATHANIMAAFAEIDQDQEMLDQLRVWLLTQKQTNMWENSASTADAIYALLMRGSDWFEEGKNVTLHWGSVQTPGVEISTEGGVVGTGFIQRRWNANEVTNEMRQLTVNNPTPHLVWGGLFRQYFVPIDEVKSSDAGMSIKRELFVETVDENGKKLIPIGNRTLKVGDKITVKLTIESQQDMSFVFVKDLRAAGFEPIEQISRYESNDGLWYYQSNTDTDMEFFIEFLPKGTHQLEYSMFVTKEGNLSNGYALIQCQYAPEFSSYSDGMRVRVGE